MPSRAEPHRGASAPHVGVVLSVAIALLISCKDIGSSDQATRALPAPEPPATTAALPREDAAPAPKKKTSGDEAGAKRSADDEAAPTPAAAPAGDTAAPAPAADTSDTAAPAAPASAPAVSAPSAACVGRCQGAMQSCLSAPVDGGVPGFGNLEVCKKAFEACQSACGKP